MLHDCLIEVFFIVNCFVLAVLGMQFLVLNA